MSKSKFVLDLIFIGAGLSLKNLLVIVTLTAINSQDVGSSIVLIGAAIIGAFLRFAILYSISMFLVLISLYILNRTKLDSLTKYVIAFYPLAISGIINAVVYFVKNIFVLREVVMFGGWLFSYLLLAKLLLHNIKRPVPVFFSAICTAIAVFYLLPPVP
ncbi:hypothetical protein [Thermococcus sp. JdF3]|uniref:hypothetical protein n=1 Tax=Thermococcus sp. JdF3 TaxID=1638258 RepID=UPI00143A86FD|nr:hypothetical protein [Thermococcus sp. JdF3]NJE02013.1 hypothetical protein [Thermococcus sp. JdF3]